MNQMPTLQTARLIIRPFEMVDLPQAHHLFDSEISDADLRVDKQKTLAERATWLQWTVLNYHQLAKLHQPPYGDRAIILKTSGDLIGACGYVPCLDAFYLLPNFDQSGGSTLVKRNTTELGLFYAIARAYRKQGYATEAALALIEYAFQTLDLVRVVATTEYTNAGSISVMQKLGMRVEKNPHPQPPWLQVVGVLENTI